MLDIADELHRWSGLGAPFAVATVVAIGGSAPRQPGAALAVDGGGNAIGSVSGGCVEGAVYERCQEVLAAGPGAAPVLEHFGYSDDDAFAVGLTCGGEIDILVQRIDPAARPEITGALAAAVSGEAAAVARVVEGPAELMGRALLVRSDGTYEGSLGDPERDRTAAAETSALLAAGRTATWTPRWPRDGSTAVPCCASSPMTPSSTSRCWNAPCGCPSPTSAPWARAAPTWTGSTGCGRPASPNST
jgi:xanthine dehydrogenase accessory factor